jgi:hypothetical protein
MLRNRIVRWAIMLAFIASTHWAGAQSRPATGLYQIISGTYGECCGIAGEFRSSLPNENQSFVRLTVEPQSGIATMAFLRADGQTIFSVVPCAPGDPINFNLVYGFFFSNSIVFHVDPGPPPYAVFWNYSVSHSTDSLRINGTLGTAQQFCADVPTQFGHSNVVAVLVPGPTLRITEFSKDGPLLFIQGNTGWTNVIEASADSVAWSPISTNLMPNTLCPICPYILFRDAGSTNLARRFYRCFEIP